MIEIRSLSKHFGPFRAVDNISFKVEPGEVLGFLGPNGAGKSTTMKMVTGFLAPSSGTVKVCGYDVRQRPMAVKSRIGYLPEGAPLYPDMTALGLLRFVAAARKLGRRSEERIREVVRQVELEDVLHQRIETLSKGFKRRVGLAQAILHDPQVLVLDEPTDGLDPNQKHQVRELIRNMAPGKVIVLSTHILEEVESVCTRAIIIAEGRLLFDGTPADLRRRSRYHNAIALTVKIDTAPGAVLALRGLDAVSHVEEQAEAEPGFASYLVFPEAGRSILRPVSDFVHARGWEVEHMHVEAGRLDDVFRSVTLGEDPEVTLKPKSAAGASESRRELEGAGEAH